MQRPDPRCDVQSVAAEYQVEPSELLTCLAPFLDQYLEFAFSDEDAELITGGRECAAALTEAAARLGLGDAPCQALLATDARFPRAMLGLKVSLRRRTTPTLYHRSMLPLDQGLAHLATFSPLVPHLDDLARALSPAQTLYGLGFTEDGAGLRVKTYVLGQVGSETGFRSVRVGARGVEQDVREYLPDAQHDGSTAARRGARIFAEQRFGHIARSTQRGAKVYLERRGAIATDFSRL
jgi:hypothetical protein